ncbi:diguanylate cyclase domain-containing protein, partial [Rhizobium bangladeshense]
MESDVKQRQDPARAPATVAFIDIAGFSAIADVYGDAAAIDVLEVFESMVRDALSGYEPPIKWIGDEAMLSFPEPDTAIQVLGSLLQACRREPR